MEHDLLIPPFARFRMELTGQTPYDYQMKYDLGRAKMKYPPGNPLLGNPYAKDRHISRETNSILLPHTSGTPLWGIDFVHRSPELVDSSLCRTFERTIPRGATTQPIIVQNELVHQLDSEIPLGLVQRVYEAEPDNALRLVTYSAVGFADNIKDVWSAQREWFLFTLHREDVTQGDMLPVQPLTQQQLQLIHDSDLLITDVLDKR